MTIVESPRANALLVRDADEADMAQVQAIYRHYVLNGLATFEETEPSVAEMIARRASVLAEADRRVVGYSYATSYRPRPAYRYTIENSVYVAHDLHAQGVGTALLTTLIARCEAGPWRQMIAVIGNSGNTGSIALHAKFDFQPVGTLSSVGFKLGQWVDTVLMQKALGAGSNSVPGNGSEP